MKCQVFLYRRSNQDSIVWAEEQTEINETELRIQKQRNTNLSNMFWDFFFKQRCKNNSMEERQNFEQMAPEPIGHPWA